MTAVASRPAPGRFTQSLVLTLTVAVFAAVVAFVTLRLRAGIHAQMLQSVAQTLSAVASLELEKSAADDAKLDLSETPGELLAAGLKASKFRGVLGIRVFDQARHFTGGGPWVWSEDPPGAEDWTSVAAGQPLARLHRQAQPSVAGLIADPTVPLLEAWVPLRRTDNGPIAGAAQFWIDGRPMAADLSTLDRHLAVQASLAWLAGALVIVVTLSWAFRRLGAANRELRTRSEDLQRANRELVLAAKTSALGAVTAHLIHEIKNPVAGLELFVANQNEAGGRGENGAELAAATELTKRLRGMINDVVGVLQDEQHGARFELTCAELVELALAKARPAAAARRIEMTSEVTSSGSLPGRRANLVALVLRNLLQNAIEATPSGREVRLGCRPGAGEAIEFSVEDSGPGVPDAISARLFQPCTSTKPGGSGLGLALSHQLAQQAGGRLELVRSNSTGTYFRLSLYPVD